MDDQRLNELLDAWTVEAPRHELRQAVLAAAPTRRRLGFGFGGRFAAIGGVRLWFAGAGIAAAVAGVSCGVAFSSVAAREAQDEALITSVTAEASAAISPLAEPTRSL